MTLTLDATLAGMLEQQAKVDSIANNLANVSTTGYKRAAVRFSAALDTAQILAAVDGGEPLPGGGVQAASSVRIFDQGPLLASGRPLDLAVRGPGLFRILRADGASAVLDGSGTGSVAAATGEPDSTDPGVYTVTSSAGGALTITFAPSDGTASSTISTTVTAGEERTDLIPGVTITIADTLVNGVDTIKITRMAYTRDGSFRMDAYRRLVTANGDLVYPPITLPLGASLLRIGADGAVVAKRPYTEAELAALGPFEPRDGLDELAGTIWLARFDNPSALAAAGNNLFVETTDSQSPMEGPPGQGMGEVVSGFLEGSNVGVAEELVALMEAHRAYQINLAAYRTIQQMLTEANQLT